MPSAFFNRTPRPVPALVAFCLLAGLAPAALAATESLNDKTDLPPSRYLDVEIGRAPRVDTPQFVLGSALTYGPDYLGASHGSLSLQPVLAVRFGRFKLSSSGGSSVMNFGSVNDDAGASAELLHTSRLRIKTSLRLGGGRSSGDSPDLAGLPDIRRTVFARLSTSYALTDSLSADTTLGWDLLGRGNGGFVSTGLAYRWRVTPQTEFTTGLGITWANATRMNNLFGVPPDAQTGMRTAFEPGSGWQDAGASIGFMSSLSSDWIAFGGVSVTKVLGHAADSPLTTAATGYSARMGIAWRCCK
ncbi:MAG: MipA/OmpV family protein [Burkholderiaceae bacterium]